MYNHSVESVHIVKHDTVYEYTVEVSVQMACVNVSAVWFYLGCAETLIHGILKRPGPIQFHAAFSCVIRRVDVMWGYYWRCVFSLQTALGAKAISGLAFCSFSKQKVAIHVRSLHVRPGQVRGSFVKK